MNYSLRIMDIATLESITARVVLWVWLITSKCLPCLCLLGTILCATMALHLHLPLQPPYLPPPTHYHVLLPLLRLLILLPFLPCLPHLLIQILLLQHLPLLHHHHPYYYLPRSPYIIIPSLHRYTLHHTMTVTVTIIITITVTVILSVTVTETGTVILNTKKIQNGQRKK